jgi:hypothetical protein
LAEAYEVEVLAPGAVLEEQPIIRGHFTQALLAALRGGAARPEGGVTADKLKDYLYAETPRIASKYGHSQFPQVNNGLPSDPPVVFGKALPAIDAMGNPIVKVILRFGAERRGQILLEDGSVRKIRQDDVSTGPWQLALKPGLYLLTEVATGLEKYIRIEAGRVHDVEF